MATRLIAAVSEHWLVGTLPPTEVRIQDILNDGRTDFFRMSSAHVCPIGEPATCLTTLSDVVIPKDGIEFVSLMEDRHEAPVKRRNNMVMRALTDIFMILGRYRVHGELHVSRSNQDSFNTMQIPGQKFVPVTKASIEFGLTGEHRNAPVVFANRELVSAFQIGARATAERDSGETTPASLTSQPECPEEELLRMIRSVITDGEPETHQATQPRE